MRKYNLKNCLKIVTLIFGTLLLFINCENDEISNVLEEELNYKTVSVDEAKQIFENFKKTRPSNYLYRASDSNELVISPLWETIEQNELPFTDALMTEVETMINRDGDYSSKAIFIEVNNVLIAVLETQYAFERYSDGDLKNGLVYYNDFDGNFLDAYKIQDGLTTKRYVLSGAVQEAGFFLAMLLQNFDDPNCWNTDNLPDDSQLDEVIVTAPSQNNNNSVKEIFIFHYVIPTSGNNSPGGGGGGSSGTSDDCVIANSLDVDCDTLLAFEQDYRTQMSTSELTLFESLDRTKQLKYLQSALDATVMSESFYPPTSANPCSLNNGIGDAYRHALWNALCTVKLGETLTEQLTTAHEDKPAPTGYSNYYKEKQMDLYNNARGREIGSSVGFPWQLVKTALENGELRYLTPLNTPTNCRAASSSLLTPTN